MAKGKLESTQAKLSNCSTDLAFVPDKELVELVWKNDQISMQGQFNKTQKIPSCTGFSKEQENDAGDTITTKILKFGTSDSILNNFSLSGPLGHMGLGQEDEVAHWLSYPLDDYSSEFFSELSGVNLNVHLEQNNAAPSDKNCTNGHIVLDSHSVPIYGGATPELQNAFKVFGEGHEPSNSLSRSSQLCSSPMQQRQTSLPLHRSSVSDSTTRNVPSTHQAPCVNSTRNLASTSRPPNTSMQKQNTAPSRPPLLPSHNTGFVNFSHFLRRPSTLSKTNLQSIDTAASPASSSIDRFRSYDKLSVVGSSNPIESTVIELPSGSTSITGFQSQTDSMPGMVDVRPSMGKPPKEPLFAKQSIPLCQEDAFWKTSGFAESVDIERPDSGKTAEPLVASSSACSDTSAGGASNDPKHVLKRKSRDTEESEYPSEDVEEESVARKSATARGSTGTKRSRAAEVHNLSERRRRDRINEKMRALQELIPNCNKVDKASMLDEAIEYLKSLQLQVQIMSMGTGLFVPPMMLPTGMQPMRAPHMAHFSTMGIGMGTGMGRVTGMLDMSGGSSGCPLIQVPPMHRPQVPCPPLSGPSKTGSSIQMFGFSGQGLPMPMPHASFIPFSGGPFTKLISLPVVSGAATPLEVPSSQLIPIIAECSQNQTSTQAKRERERKAKGLWIKVVKEDMTTLESTEDFFRHNSNGRTRFIQMSPTFLD